MKKSIAFLLLIFSCFSYSQVNVTNTQNPFSLTQNTLVGNGVTPYNIKFNGVVQTATSPVRDQASQFLVNFNPTNLGLTGQGLLLTTGKSSVALGPNNASGAYSGTATPVTGDADLALLVNNSSTPIKNVAILEFDFVATGLSLNFDFVFGSEEYPEYVNSPYNDAFGFFLSGPGITGPYSLGAKNIALIPTTTTPISIGTVNNGFNNNGTCTNCAYYYNNSAIGVNPNTSGLLTVQYDGFTTPIRATSQLQCGQVYHIKLAIANVNDNQLDSGVFIKNFAIAPLVLIDNYGLASNPDVCYGDTITINSNLVVGTNTFVWTKDGVVISGQSGPTLTVTESGLYALHVYTSGNCLLATDDIVIGYRPQIPITNPTDLNLCTLAAPPYIFDANQTTAVLGTLNPSEYVVTYYNTTYQNAFDGGATGLISNPNVSAYSTNTTTTPLWIRVEETAFGCVVAKPFSLNVIPSPSGTISYASTTYSVANTVGQNNLSVVTPGGIFTATPAGLSIDPNTGIFTPNTSLPNTYVIKYTIAASGNCPLFSPPTFTVTIAPLPTVTVNSPDVCSGSLATVTATPGVPTGSYSYAWTVPVGFTNPGNTPSFTTNIDGTYSVIITDTTNNLVSQSASGIVTLIPLPTVTVTSPTICSGSPATITAIPGAPGNYFYSWTTLPAGVTNPGDVSSFSTAIPGVYGATITRRNFLLCDSDFETLASVPQGSFLIINQINSPCWKTTATDGMIEVWSNGLAGVNSYSGNQFIELNANEVSTLYQNLTIVPGTTATIGFAHRARVGTDVMGVEIGPVGGPYVSLGQFSATSNAWVFNSLNYTFPNNAVTDYTIRFVSVSTGSVNNTYGNFIDAVSINIDSCTSSLALGTLTVNDLPTVSVNSPSVCIGSSATVTATPGTSGAYSFVWTVPVGFADPGNVASFNTIQAGVYSVVITNTVTGCFSTSASGTVSINPLPTITGTTSICVGVTSQLVGSGNPSTTNPWSTSNPAFATVSNTGLVTAVAPGTATITYTNINGCFAQTSVTSFVLPTVTLNSPSACFGNSATLNASPGSVETYNYIWAVPSGQTDPGNVAAFNSTQSGLYSVYITNTVTGCSSTSASGTLTINPLPVAITPNTMNGCSNGVSTSTSFNLALNNSTITNGVADVTVTYYETLLDAQNQTNSVSIPYTNTSNPQTLFVRVQNDLTGCYTTTTLQLNVTQGPVANTPSPLEVCDPDSNGFNTFDLTSVINQITGGPTPGVQVNFYETPTDAQNDTNALTSPYPNIVPDLQTLYVRVSYALTGCSNFVTLQLIVHDTPEATQADPLEVCDDNTDGLASFNLTLASAGVLGSLNPAQYTVSYYVLQANALAGTNPITNVTSFVNSNPLTQTIWVRVEDNIAHCSDVVPLDLIVNSLPVVPFPVPSYNLCDYNNTGDQIEQFDLSTKIPDAIGTQNGLLVSFYFSAAEALSGTNPLPNLYSNTSNAQTIHVRVENSITHCLVTSTMDLRVESLPSPVAPTTAVVECDSDSNGFTSFDLDALIPSILSGAPGIAITFYETQQDANDATNAIVSPYTNINQQIQFIYVRAENILTHCFSTIMIELNANPAPVIPPATVLQDINKCDSGTNNQNGLTTFNLTVQNAGILAAQTGPAANYTITYYTSLANAQAGTAPIITPTAFNNTSNPQTIWVRVKDNTTGCHSVGSFQLTVNIPMVYVTPSPLSLCDDGPTSALPTRVFDLTVRNNTITNNQPGFSVTYYPSYADLLAGTNVITNPTSYTNIANAQTLGVMVSNASGCASYGTLDIRVLPLPTPRIDPSPLVKCDDTNSPNGTELFNLTVNQNYIRNNDPGLTFAYYLSQSDADLQINPIATPTAYEVGTTTIWIRVMNAQVNSDGNRCYVLVQQSVVVNLLPVVTVNPIYTICDTTFTGVATFTLNSMNSTILGTQTASNFAISYHLTAADAQTGANALPNSYPNTSNPQVIYIRMVNNTTGCVNPAGTMTLRVAAGALIGTPATWGVCDYEFTSPNGVTTFDLTQLDTQVLAGQNPTLFTVAYFTNLADATLGTNAISNLATYQTAATTIWIVVTNTTTLCRSEIRTVSLVVEPLAEPVITSSTGSNTICVQWITGTATDPLVSGLTLDSGITAPNYSFQWSLDGTPIPGAIFATHTITTDAPGDYSVVATSVNPPMLGCVSNQSAIFTVVKSGPAAAIGTGYEYITAFEDIQNIIVTVQGYGTYHYQLDNGPILDNGGIFENVTFGTHTITVYDVKGNTPCDNLTISNILVINYPHFFTPNGDGVNEEWNIVGLNTQPNAKIYIFDRFGKLVKQISSTGTGWDGTFNGASMPATDYWFTVQFLELGTDKIFKAHFSLKR